MPPKKKVGSAKKKKKAAVDTSDEILPAFNHIEKAQLELHKRKADYVTVEFVQMDRRPIEDPIQWSASTKVSDLPAKAQRWLEVYAPAAVSKSGDELKVAFNALKDGICHMPTMHWKPVTQSVQVRLTDKLSRFQQEIQQQHGRLENLQFFRFEAKLNEYHPLEDLQRTVGETFPLEYQSEPGHVKLFFNFDTVTSSPLELWEPSLQLSAEKVKQLAERDDSFLPQAKSAASAAASGKLVWPSPLHAPDVRPGSCQEEVDAFLARYDRLVPGDDEAAAVGTQ